MSKARCILARCLGKNGGTAAMPSVQNLRIAAVLPRTVCTCHRSSASAWAAVKGAGACVLQQLRALTSRSHRVQWYSNSPGRRALSSHGGKEGERGKATGAGMAAADEGSTKLQGEGLASFVFGSPLQKSATRAASSGQRRMRRQKIGLIGHGNSVREGGAGVRAAPAHLNKLWAWARERARLNSKVKVDWLSGHNIAEGGGKGRGKTAESSLAAGAGESHSRQVLDVQGQGLASAHKSKHEATHEVALPSGHAHASGALEPLTREFWDALLLQRDPTKGLRQVALRSLMYEDGAGGAPEPTPVDPTLWWMEDMIRIKWGGGGYLPEGLRRGEESAPVHGEKVLINHVIQVVAQAPCRLRVRWAALLHDVGKPATADKKSGKLTFVKHERVGALMVERILGAYGYDDKFCKEVASLVLRSGRIRMVEQFNDQGARRLMAIMGPLFDDLLDLYAADCTSAKTWRQAEHQARANLLSQHVQAVLDRDRVTSLRAPLNGHDIMQITGLCPGGQLGLLVRALRADYLKHGPYSASKAHEVVAHLHAQLQSGDIQRHDHLPKGVRQARTNWAPCTTERTERDRDPASEYEKLGRHALFGRHELLAPRKRRPHLSKHVGFSSWKPLQVGKGVDAEEDAEEQEEVLVFRLRFDRQRSNEAQWRGSGGGGGGDGVLEDGEVFRDVAVRRDTSLYTLAKIVAHAFDLDFDDDFAFYRRKRGLECPGAEAAYSVIPAAARRDGPSQGDAEAQGEADAEEAQEGAGAQQLRVGKTSSSLIGAQAGEDKVGEDGKGERAGGWHRADARGGQDEEEHKGVPVVHREPLLDLRFELLARALGEALRSENTGGFAFRYDRRVGLARVRKGQQGSESIEEWRPEEDDDDLADGFAPRTEMGAEDDMDFGVDEWLNSAGGESLSYPLRIPQVGPASLIHTLVGNLFDQSRRSLMYALYNGGPWYIRIDFIEARERKHYETSLPSVTARLGHVPRGSFISAKRVPSMVR